MASRKKSDGAIKIDEPVEISHTQFVDYAFDHWASSLKAGTRPKTLCLLGPPGIGKSSTAYSIRDKMTKFIRENPEVIFGDMPEAEGIKDEKSKLAKKLEIAIQRLDADRRTLIEEEQYAEVIAGKLPAEDCKARVEFVFSHLKPLDVDAISAFAELLDFSSKLPEDLGGLPFRSADGFTDYCPQRWVAKLCRKYAFGIYVQDDLPASPQAMQVAGRQSALERRIHENRFADGVLVLVTGNRRQDKSSASALPAHFRNSVTLLSIKLELKEWLKWYGKQKGLSGLVPAYLKWQPDLLSELPTDATGELGAFATPRQWASLGAQFEAAHAQGGAVLLAVASGLIGKGNALNFTAFVEIYNELVPPQKVLDDPKGALPDPVSILDEPSKQIAMVMALGEYAGKRWTKSSGKEKDEAPVKLFTAVAWVTAAVGDEYSAVAVQNFLDNGGDLTALARVARMAKTDPEIGRLLDHVKRAMLNS